MPSKTIVGEHEITFNSDGLFATMLGFGLCITQFCLNNEEENSFDKKVRTSGLVNEELFEELTERIVKRVSDKIESAVYESEYVQLYSWHYIAASWALDKEAFYKWFLVYDGGQWDTSDECREWVFNTQRNTLSFFHQTKIWNSLLENQKKKLIEVFGEFDTVDFDILTELRTIENSNLNLYDT